MPQLGVNVSVSVVYFIGWLLKFWWGVGGVCVRARAGTRTYAQYSENSFWESVLSFHQKIQEWLLWHEHLLPKPSHQPLLCFRHCQVAQGILELTIYPRLASDS